MRSVVCAVLALLAAVATSVTVVLALTGTVAADPDRPGRLGALALSSPGLQEEATQYLVDALQEQGIAAGADERQVRRATEQALVDPAVREALAELEVSDQGEIRLDGVYAAVADRLEEEGRPAEAQRLRDLPSDASTSGTLGNELGQVAQAVRAGLLVGSLVTGVVALVLAAFALAAARRRLLCLGSILFVAGVLVAVGLEVLPALAGEDDVAGDGWLSVARGLAEVLGPPATVSAVALVATGALLALLGLRRPRPAESARVHA